MKKVTLYTTPFCPFCIQAKRLLKKLEIPFEDHDVSSDHELRRKISNENGGWRTVPMILVGDNFVGGYSELAELHSQGKLDELLNG